VATSWHIKGDYVLACNCDYGCPCNFNARPTMGYCQGVIGFQVADGAYGEVRLDNVKAFIAAKWPGAIHEGNGVAAIYIDEAATPEQREGLLKIMTGEAGGPPFGILAGTFSHFLEPRFVSIDLELAGQDTQLAIDGRIKVGFQPILNPVTKAEAYPKVVLPEGFIFKEGEQYSLKEFWVSDGPELSFTHPGKVGELAKVSWSGP
jgi:hypothetical protein